MKLAPAFERLLEGWKAQGYELVAMRDLVAAQRVLARCRCTPSSNPRSPAARAHSRSRVPTFFPPSSVAR